jgi:hypothetical protein
MALDALVNASQIQEDGAERSTKEHLPARFGQQRLCNASKTHLLCKTLN